MCKRNCRLEFGWSSYFLELNCLPSIYGVHTMVDALGSVTYHCYFVEHLDNRIANNKLSFC